MRSPARGIVNGLLLGLVAWWLLILVGYLAWSDVRSWIG